LAARGGGGRRREAAAGGGRRRRCSGVRDVGERERERELFQGGVRLGTRDPYGSPGAGAGARGESSPAQVGSSNRASLAGRAEKQFSVQLGTAR
jgi:hypothetical protein